jgi:hypothetical protein
VSVNVRAIRLDVTCGPRLLATHGSFELIAAGRALDPNLIILLRGASGQGQDEHCNQQDGNDFFHTFHHLSMNVESSVSVTMTIVHLFGDTKKGCFNLNAKRGKIIKPCSLWASY